MIDGRIIKETAIHFVLSVPAERGKKLATLKFKLTDDIQSMQFVQQHSVISN